MSKFMMMVGLPGSGKTTFAKKLLDSNTVLLSSDELRKELFGDETNQENNALVFEEMNKRTSKLLKEGKNVIYDATNINRKRRKHVVRHVATQADQKIVYYMNESFKNSQYNNASRDRTVPLNTMLRMYKTLQIPVKNEGWDKVIFVNKELNGLEDKLSKKRELLEYVLYDKNIEHGSLFTLLVHEFELVDFDDIYNLPHDSSYHSFSVSRHTYHVFKHIQDTYEGESLDKLKLLWAALFHDLGKATCKSFTNYKGEETRYANFKGHEFVSSQKTAYELALLGYDLQFVQDVAALVQFHMVPKKQNEKKLNETKELLGDELFEKLMILDEADKLAK